MNIRNKKEHSESTALTIKNSTLFMLGFNCLLSCFNPWAILAPPFINVFLTLAPCLLPLILSRLLLVKHMPTCLRYRDLRCVQCALYFFTAICAWGLLVWLVVFFFCFPAIKSILNRIIFFFFPSAIMSLCSMFVIYITHNSKNEAEIWARYRPCS